MTDPLVTRPATTDQPPLHADSLAVVLLSLHVRLQDPERETGSKDGLFYESA